MKVQKFRLSRDGAQEGENAFVVVVPARRFKRGVAKRRTPAAAAIRW